MKKGTKRPPFSKEWRENISKSHIGYKHSEKTLEKMVERCVSRAIEQQKLGDLTKDTKNENPR